MSHQTTSRGERRRPRNDPNKRTPLACTRCRDRKTKCMGELPCRACQLAGKECVYVDPGRKILVPSTYLYELERRARDLEKGNNQSSGSVQAIALEQESVPDAGTSPSSSQNAESEIVDDSWIDGMDKIVLSPSGGQQYRGSSSSNSLGMRFRDFIKPMSANLNFETEVEKPYTNTAWPRRPSISVMPDLPPKEIARRLYASQHEYIGTIFSFLQPQEFEKRLQWVYDEERPDFSVREACLSYCQILMIFAFGQMYSINQWMGNEGPPGFSYFMQALKLLPEIYEEGSILFVEVLSLVGYYMQNLNRRDAAFLYIGLALRMAISIGLHQEVADSTLDEIEREHRRRVWWSVYSMDRILCVKSGNPITIADEDIGVELPSPVPNVEPENAPAIVLSHYTQLSKILGKIMEEIYRKSRNSGSTLVASVQSIMNSLNDWFSNLPEHLRIDFDKLEKDISRESVSIFLHYYQCINMTARPLLFHAVQQRLKALVQGQAGADWRDGLPPATVKVIRKCIAAARSSTAIMTAAAKQNLVATYGFMDGEHAFSAALVLVMVNIAFPYNEKDGAAMKAALELLRGMADRGNSHMRARHSLLIDLQSVIGRLPSQQASQPIPSSPSPPTPQDKPIPLPYHPNTTSNPSIPHPSPLDPIPMSTIDFNDINFDLNTTEDVSFMDEVSNNIGIGMDFDWIEAALRNENNGIGMWQSGGF